MENFLSNFANVSKEVTSECAKIKVSPEFYGTIGIKKGLLNMKIRFFVRLYKSLWDNCVSIDDWDITEIFNISFGDMPIDDIDKLKSTLRDSGLKSVAEGLEINRDDMLREVSKQIESSKQFKDLFGEEYRMFYLLSEEEKNKIHLKYAIDNYEKIAIHSFEVRNFLKLDENGNKVMPTLDELKAML
jgi:hypothetical protein